MDRTMAFSEEHPFRVGKFELGHNGAKPLSGDVNIIEFEAIMSFVAYCLKGAPWWAGDLLNEADRRFGDGYAQCVPTNLSNSQANRLRSVAEKVPAAHRRPLTTLSQGHYDTLARLPVIVQPEFLDRAVTEGLGTNEFRDLAADYLRMKKAEAKERAKDVEERSS